MKVCVEWSANAPMDLECLPADYVGAVARCRAVKPIWFRVLILPRLEEYFIQQPYLYLSACNLFVLRR